jgi:hypothetical protein
VRTGAPIAPPCVDPVAAYCVNESESVLYLEEK